MRYLQLDFIRGLAIIFMIIFHLSFDLNNFHFINIDIYHAKEWHYYRMLIVSMFILCVGISLALVNENGIKIKKEFKRFIFLSFASLMITFASLITFAQSWIYFGVLHFITVASVLALAFVRYEWLSLIVGVLIVLLFNLGIINMHWLYNATSSILHLPYHTEDLVPLTPWFGVVLIGIFIGKKRLFLFPLQENKATNSIALLGKHSLLIYLAHQPLFFGSIALADYLIH
ncbi:heparan-alpha-glucosaminide N-acetyltransferase [Sulfurimonas sp.]|uniref:heparan-alpha-glucosaminide N-acetyltransferase n=1 Tax=Sulfurimonas sp. TaxID=2022749 RepID=UPI002627C2F5|nr:heparan-alpha-glucosaminide N-acetyltransferase [Sulfurimonas sp.]